MTHTKILFGQILISLLLVLAMNWAATQWAADQFAYQPGLGRPWFMAGELPVYKPWRLFQWWYAYDTYAPDIFARAGLLAASGGLLATVAAVIGSVLRARHQKFVTTYGSARWANTRQIRRAGLLSKKGVFLGLWEGRYLRHSGPEHVMAFAPTRSGKGVGLVVPTLLSWTSSAIIHDIKGENWSLTSEWRSSFSNCYRFDPTDPDSVRFNPLLEVRRGHNEVRDVQNIADILVDPEGSLERRNHWERTAHALLTGVLLHVLYAEADKTLAGAARFLSDPERSIGKTLQHMLTANHLGTEDKPVVHPVVAQAARELLNKSENERSGVISTAISCLTLFRDPVIAQVTSESDLSIRDLVLGDRPASLYFVVPPSDLSRTKPLIRLMLNQIGRRLTEVHPDRKSTQRQLLLMLDEFPALGRLEFFESTLAFFAGYRIRAFLIAQSLNQIEKAYGPVNAILDNCPIRVAFATNDERTAKRVSDALGTATEQRSQRNYTGHRLSPWLPHVMVSRQETSRPLLTPGEVMQFPPTEEIIMVSGRPPVRATKIRYYADENFIGRTGEAPMGRNPGQVAIEGTWTNVAAAAAIAPETSGDADEVVAGGLKAPETSGGLSLEIALVEQAEPKVAEEPVPIEPANDLKAAEDAEAARAREVIRRAHGLDRDDDDLLPGF